MNKALLEDLLELAKREKAKWEKRILEINAELHTEENRQRRQSPKTDKPKKDSKTAQTEKKIIEILAASEVPLGPKEIVEKGKQAGVELKNNIVRQILSRSKDDKFFSPQRGLWKIKEKI